VRVRTFLVPVGVRVSVCTFSCVRVDLDVSVDAVAGMVVGVVVRVAGGGVSVYV